MKENNTINHRPYLYNLGDTFETRHGTMTVVGMLRIQREDKVFRKHYTLQCEKGHQYDVKEEYLKAGRLRTCKKCNHPPIIDSDPDFAAWFVDPSIPLLRSRGCHDKADFYCQRCGKIVRGKSISNVHKRRQVPCPYCANGVSYPERYMIALLEQLRVPFVHQHTVRFTRDGHNRNYKYDFYDPERQLVIETHGQQHMEPGAFERLGGQTLEMIQQNDAEKEHYATRVLDLKYVALDCRRSDPNWIRREVINKLSFYPLESVDWYTVQVSASKSLILQLISLSKQGYTQKQIGEIVHMSPSTISVKLQKAIRDGLYDGITPRTLQAAENKRLLEEKRVHNQKEKERREALRRLSEQQRSQRLALASAFQNMLDEKMRTLRPDLFVMEPYKSSRTRLSFLCTVCNRKFFRSPADMLKDDSCPWCKKNSEYREKFESKYGSEYELDSFYTNHHTQMKVLHKVCGEVFYRLPGELMKYGCPGCGKRRRSEKSSATRRQQSEIRFAALLPDIERRGYTYAGNDFQGLSKPNAFLCSHCGELWWTTANSILSGRNHICISPCRKKTHEEFVRQVHALTGSEYTVLSKYNTALTQIKLRHNVCGLEYLTTPAHFTSTGRRCPVCTRLGTAEDAADLQKHVENAQLIYSGWELVCKESRKSPPSLSDHIWNQKYADACDFYRLHGHTDIPYGHMTRGYDLGGWLGEQRKFYRRGKLPADRVHRLEALGISWNCKEDAWQRRYEEVKRYLQEHGRVRLNNSCTKEECSCYYWIHDQIKRCRLNRVSPEKVALLREIGIHPDHQGNAYFDTVCEKHHPSTEKNGPCVALTDDVQKSIGESGDEFNE